jgi:hypothetical protein
MKRGENDGRTRDTIAIWGGVAAAGVTVLAYLDGLTPGGHWWQLLAFACTFAVLVCVTWLTRDRGRRKGARVPSDLAPRRATSLPFHTTDHRVGSREAAMSNTPSARPLLWLAIIAGVAILPTAIAWVTYRIWPPRAVLGALYVGLMIVGVTIVLIVVVWIALRIRRSRPRPPRPTRIVHRSDAETVEADGEGGEIHLGSVTPDPVTGVVRPQGGPRECLRDDHPNGS